MTKKEWPQCLGLRCQATPSPPSSSQDAHSPPYLCVAAHEHPLLLQQTDEVVTERRLQRNRQNQAGNGEVSPTPPRAENVQALCLSYLMAHYIDHHYPRFTERKLGHGEADCLAKDTQPASCRVGIHSKKSSLAPESGLFCVLLTHLSLTTTLFI